MSTGSQWTKERLSQDKAGKVKFHWATYKGTGFEALEFSISSFWVTIGEPVDKQNYLTQIEEIEQDTTYVFSTSVQ